MRMNTKPHVASIFTHEGGRAAHITPEMQLRRSVMSCMLWESEFYEDGKTIGQRIMDLCAYVKPEIIAKFAYEARHIQHLRHVPLLLLKGLVKHGHGSMVADAIVATISRADELAEFMAILLSDLKSSKRGDGVGAHVHTKKTIPAQVKKGLARAFQKFDAHQLAKYNRDAAVKLRDVLFMIHAKPKDEAQAALWKSLIDGTLPSAQTWEHRLSGGADKKTTFEAMINDGSLGYFALIRNLRGMLEARVDINLLRKAIVARGHGADKILPFRFVAAARAAPQLERELDIALYATVESGPELAGETVVMVDVSASMDSPISAMSDMKRIDAAAALASVIKGNLRVFTFSGRLVEVPARHGMAGVDAIIRSQEHGGTYLRKAMEVAAGKVGKWPDRLIVITDEQSHDGVAAVHPGIKSAWMINVASAQNGVGYGQGWNHIDGWSDNVIRYIVESERMAAE